MMDNQKGAAAVALAIAAGSVDVVGLAEIGRYDSHMTGTATHAMLRLVVGDKRLMLFGLLAVACFLIGTIIAGFIIGPEGARRWQRTAALLALAEATLIAIGGVLMLAFPPTHGSGMMVIACFALAMGIQNRSTTRLMGPFRRTTHVTSNLTDFGGAVGTILRRGRRRAEDENGSDVRSLAGPAFPTLGFTLGGLVGAIAAMLIGRGSGLAIAILPAIVGFWLSSINSSISFGPSCDL